MSGGQLSGGQLSGGQLSGGQLSGGQLSGGQLSPTPRRVVLGKTERMALCSAVSKSTMAVTGLNRGQRPRRNSITAAYDVWCLSSRRA